MRTHSTELNPFCRDNFPDLSTVSVTPWAGLRPMMPSMASSTTLATGVSAGERAGHKGRFFSFASNADSGAQKGVHFEGAGLDGVWREIRRDRPGFAGVVAEMVPRGGRRVEKLVAARMLPLFSGDIRNSVRRGGERYDLLFQRAA
ncbi:hypothetical protein EMIHUDRAFT_217295 [Emiliania huxleyi CCMP1516]|uniref:Uncharacterized protein n=2 Tax=Emiliania huxleyi TaxID=2903 RepID=A0A0D3IBE7_EMIH1|nr:hypothetical protein EMIHUDRAFT_217295 [Emiliania huxleyi CCMP1516]EOD08582.1 hypothetical protein EMIHUDRAFT_217295 [Emiliania huxleyi CCMP1516]|eukprot:XP_005761011.1 hypothetical protein EMIHUDRAFT_217295 [Emiliania huxleyi CCMP1516]